MLSSDSIEHQLSLIDRSHPASERSTIQRAPRHVTRTRIPRTDISIKAVNHDNHKNADQLADLFRRCYGASYPAKEVYDPEHWYSPDNDCFNAELGHCMTSMVATHGNRIVAHMALRHEPHARRVEFLYPAIHPAYRKRVFEFCRLFWNTVTDLADRQKWELVYFYNVLAHPMWQLVANKCFDSVETAIIPNSTGAKSSFSRRQDSRSSFLVMYNIFNAQNASPRPFFAPREHREFIASQFESLGLLRIPGSNSAAPTFESSPEVAEKGISLQHKEGFGIYNAVIDPERLSRPEEIERCTAQLSHNQRQRCVLSIAIDNSNAPAVCEYATRTGYRFCGIQPLNYGRDRILYSKFDPESLSSVSLYSPHAKRLRDYIERSCREIGFPFH
ncbi:MAG: hypothetical protein KDD66_16930 [Bdellovibrionales bacterium]|nr:hypothetical protein [Bdellovibrionales bacterium]